MDWLLFGISLTVVAVLWYLYCACELFLNGARPRVFSAFFRELGWYVPGGMKRRAAYIKERVCEGNGTMVSFTDSVSWEYEEIRRRGNYEEVAQFMLGSGSYFWMSRVFVPLFAVLCLFSLLRAIFS